MNSLDAIGYLAWIVAALWTLTGCAIWLRWGWCGVRWIWRHRRDVDTAVASEIAQSTAGCPFRGFDAPSTATAEAPEGSHG